MFSSDADTPSHPAAAHLQTSAVGGFWGAFGGTAPGLPYLLLLAVAMPLAGLSTLPLALAALAALALWAVTVQRNALLAAVANAEAESRAWAKELEALVGSVGGAVFSVVPNGAKVLFASARSSEIYGVAPEALCNTPFLWRELIHPADRKAVANLARQLRRSGCFEVEYRILHVGGGVRWVCHRGRLQVDTAGRQQRITGVVTDITGKKAMEERERQRQEQLAHSARLILLGEMSSSLAHEINQPLMAIAGYSAACSRAAKDCPEALALLKKIDAQVTRAGGVIGRTRDFARRHNYREAIDIPTLIFGVMDWVDAEAKRHGIRLDTSGVNTPLPEIRADRLQIEQVLLNLVNNAFEALRDVDTARHVVVTAHRTSGSGEIVISVRDTGCGVPAQVALDVFQPFFTTKPTGLGLGLAISQSIIEDHGGSLWYAATAGGTAFHFSLPTAPSAPSVPR